MNNDKNICEFINQIDSGIFALDAVYELCCAASTNGSNDLSIVTPNNLAFLLNLIGNELRQGVEGINISQGVIEPVTAREREAA